MDKKERLYAAFNFLRSAGIVHTQLDIAELMHASPSTVSGAFKGVERSLTDKFIMRFNKDTGRYFNDDWLLTGEGEMLRPGKAQQPGVIYNFQEVGSSQQGGNSQTASCINFQQGDNNKNISVPTPETQQQTTLTYSPESAFNTLLKIVEDNRQATLKSQDQIDKMQDQIDKLIATLQMVLEKKK